MIIEKLKKEDLSLYKNLIDDCFGNSNDISVYKKKYDENGNINIIVLKEDEKIVASITYVEINLFTYNNQPCVELFNVATLTEYRKKGYNGKIMEYILKEVKEKGYKSVYMTCLESAKPAHKFYEQMVFEKMDSRKYYKEL